MSVEEEGKGKKELEQGKSTDKCSNNVTCSRDNS